MYWALVPSYSIESDIFFEFRFVCVYLFIYLFIYLIYLFIYLFYLFIFIFYFYFYFLFLFNPLSSTEKEKIPTQTFILVHPLPSPFSLLPSPSLLPFSPSSFSPIYLFIIFYLLFFIFYFLFFIFYFLFYFLLTEAGEVTRGQAYEVTVTFTLPESPPNKDIGMVCCCSSSS